MRYNANGILIMGIAILLLLILQFIIMNQTVIIFLILLGLLIPITILALKSRKSFREFQCNNCNHKFTVSHLRLIFTVKFRGADPAPTGTAAYDLKCPNCKERDWLVPLE